MILVVLLILFGMLCIFFCLKYIVYRIRRFEILTVVQISILHVRVVTLCSLVESSQQFEGT